MTFLEKFTQDQRDLMVRLPYRIGLWISQSDTAGGSEADERERQALSNILHAFAEDLFGSENLQYIMSETIRQKSNWPSWSKDVELVPGECADAITLMRDHGEPKDVKALKNHLMEIAEAVALAFHEEDSRTSVFSAVGLYVSHLFSKNKRRQRGRSFGEFLNVSTSEREALNVIVDALESV
ncbi:MAG: hypothetical protein WBK55_01635 [Alphaproteobacteria bacterium]